MLMWGVGKDEMKGKHVLLTTVIQYLYMFRLRRRFVMQNFKHIPTNGSSNGSSSEKLEECPSSFQRI